METTSPILHIAQIKIDDIDIWKLWSFFLTQGNYGPTLVSNCSVF